MANLCAVENCGRVSDARYGICFMHYRRIKRTGSFVDHKERLVAIRTPSLVDLHWAAGFLEGEGSFLFPHRVTASQVQEEPLIRLKEMFGGNVAIYERSKARQNEKICHSWNTSGARARGIMMTLYPLMSTRRKEQIKTSLSQSRNNLSTLTNAVRSQDTKFYE